MQALVLGTAQWGNAYGVTNTQGRLTDAVVAEIADLALESGISHVDTAGDYGDAEVRLARWAARLAVTTKVRGAASASVADQLRQSLLRLDVDGVRCCLVHDWPLLTDERAAEVAAELRKLKAGGLAQIVGISAYDEEDLRRAQRFFADLDAVQIPVSILDRRLDGSAVVSELADARVEIQARSVFLQGLLLGGAGTALGSHPDVRRFHDSCVEQALEPRVAALAFIKSLPWVSQLVLGVTSGRELAQIISGWAESVEIDIAGFAQSVDLSLLDPRRWS